MSLIDENIYQIQISEETTYGTDPGSGDQDIEAINVTFPDTEWNHTALDTGQVFPQSSKTGNIIRTCAFDIPLQQADTNGTEFSLTYLFKACHWGVASAETNEFDNLYTPESNSSVTIEWFQDGAKHTLLGARGTVSIVGEANNYMLARFEMTGLYNAVAATAMPGSESYDGTGMVMFKNATITYNTVDYHISSLEFTDGNNVVVIPSASNSDTEGVYQVYITKGEPRVTFNPLAETSNLTTFETAIKNGTDNTLKYEAQPTESGEDLNPVLSLGTIIQSYSNDYVDGYLRLGCDAIVTSLSLDLEQSV